MSQSHVIIIPARMGSTRLPAKAIAEFHGMTLIEHVWHCANQTGLGDVFVATDHEDIANIVKGFGGEVVMTDPECPTGSDRVAQAYERLGRQYDVVINLQGDLPSLQPHQLKQAAAVLDEGYDVGTLVFPMPEKEQSNPNSVKAIVSFDDHPEIGRLHWCCRAPLSYGHFHIGAYAYRPDALAAFTAHKETRAEGIEKLEQLRALSMGLSVGAYMTDPVWGEINTPEDLEFAKGLDADSLTSVSGDKSA